ncbi:Putative steryl acetyl hydrolase mug81 [Savitreella phatthalungensis]
MKARQGDPVANVEAELQRFLQALEELRIDLDGYSEISETEAQSDSNASVDDIEWAFCEDDVLSDVSCQVPERPDEEQHVSQAEWLAALCRRRAHTEGFASDVLYNNLIQLLLSDHSADELETSLVELLGFDELDGISRLILERRSIVDAVAATKAGSNGQRAVDGLMTKEQRRAQLHRNGGRPIFTNPQRMSANQQQYPHVYGAAQNSSLDFFGNRFALPVGSLREEHDYYEEVTIPPAQNVPPMLGEEPKLIASLDGLCRGCFKGYRSLNRIQSLVYPVAYETSENMLICAPTGAGKTDVAMLTVLQTIAAHCTPSPRADASTDKFEIMKADFKVVYVAPMKALAAEVVDKFSKKLAWLGISCRELTGDMQLTKQEIQRTQILVTTPEKWDVVTRKGMTTDAELVQKVKLLIFDEVHMLHDERGAVIETLVARTQRYVEATQSPVRVIGLSATLPNYLDVADFLGVNRYVGLFFFSSAFRPVGLEQHFIGVKGKPGGRQSNENLDKATYEQVSRLVNEGHQVMVFVHARKATVRTAQTLLEMAINNKDDVDFDPSEHPMFDIGKRDVGRSKNRELRELFVKGFGIHNAGMLRSDRNLVEKYFGEGLLKVLCCTATLAWGVNLPAYAVVIRGTQLYDPQKGSFVDLGVLDVLQIFGRAGRPQYETHGVGYICTTHDRLAHYTAAIMSQRPIESRFQDRLIDNLNAEIALGTVTKIDEAVSWLSYTYLFVRMRKNPQVYGIEQGEMSDDPTLAGRRRDLIVAAARKLHKTQMVVYDERTELLTAKDLGRIASNYYISHQSVDAFNCSLKEKMTEADVFRCISQATEFSQMQSRDTEQQELDELKSFAAPCAIKSEVSTVEGKVNVLLQAYVSRAAIDDFALVSDTNYVAQNGSRVCRALFEIVLSRSWPSAATILSVCKMLEKRMWSFEHPLAQMALPKEITHKLEEKRTAASIEVLRDMDVGELGSLVNFQRLGGKIKQAVDNFPLLAVDYELAPLTRQVLRVKLFITPDFDWSVSVHGAVESFWLWVEDEDGMEILYSEPFLLSKRRASDVHELEFTIPLPEPLPPQIFVRATSDRWLGAETLTAISLGTLVLPRDANPATELLDLQPLPITALHDPTLEEICARRFLYFNPVQTQYFHTLYNTQQNVLIGAPTGSGKTVAAELALWAAFRRYPKSKVVYIAPMKALVRERMSDWSSRLSAAMGRAVVELTGDNTPDTRQIRSADIIITTPEKWDGISRSWKNRDYVRDVSLVIIDEIHLLGSDRGPILEVIVSRMNYIADQTKRPVRILGLSTAVANPLDLADWLNISPSGLFNFRHAAPVEIHIDGFPGRAYCPRMNSMNKPAFAAIKTHAPTKPVLIFVSSRRQTRLTAKDLIALCGSEDNPRRFLKMTEDELEMILTRVQDENLKASLPFGIALHHAGLAETDRRLAEELFVNQKIQVLVATSTLAWGVNTPASLVIIKGTEFFDAKLGGYKDMDLTDVLQMLGRAGRPQYDTYGIACIFVKDNKKNFYKHFLHSGFPVESSLHTCLADHLNAEVAAGTIRSTADAFDLLQSTYFFRRVQQNPTYYDLEEASAEGLMTYLAAWLDGVLKELQLSSCIEIDAQGQLVATSVGRVTSYYYLSHTTVRGFLANATDRATFEQALQWLSDATEFDEQPVRHNEDLVNAELAKSLRYSLGSSRKPPWDPHVKAFVLLQAHFEGLMLPVTDYITDTISVLDQSVRVLQAYIDLTVDQGCLSTTLMLIRLMQSCKQGLWHDDPPCALLPGVSRQVERPVALQDLQMMKARELRQAARQLRVTGSRIEEFITAVQRLPRLRVHATQSDAQTLQVDVTRSDSRDSASGNQEAKDREYVAWTPKFPKAQTEGWFAMLVEASNDEVIALRRVSFNPGVPNRPAQAHCTLNIPRDSEGSRLTILIVSDVYPSIENAVEVKLARREDFIAADDRKIDVHIQP